MHGCVFFFIAAIGAIAGAIGVVDAAQPVLRRARAGRATCSSLAALFLLLRAEFVAAAQVVVYAGAVMVLYVFVVAYVGAATGEPVRPAGGRGLRARRDRVRGLGCSSSC